MNSFAFTPATGYRSSVDFPDPSTEAEAREQLMTLLDQVRDFINDTDNGIAGEVASIWNSIEAIVGATGDPTAIADIIDAFNACSDILQLKVCYLEEEV